MGTTDINPLKIKENTPSLGKSGYSSRTEITKSQTISKIIAPISSTIVYMENNPIPTKILLGE
jgi:hypothetical protein